jgi:hypothetical protein
MDKCIVISPHFLLSSHPPQIGVTFRTINIYNSLKFYTASLSFLFLTCLCLLVLRMKLNELVATGGVGAGFVGGGFVGGGFVGGGLVGGGLVGTGTGLVGTGTGKVGGGLVGTGAGMVGAGPMASQTFPLKHWPSGHWHTSTISLSKGPHPPHAPIRHVLGKSPMPAQHMAFSTVPPELTQVVTPSGVGAGVMGMSSGVGAGVAGIGTVGVLIVGTLVADTCSMRSQYSASSSTRASSRKAASLAASCSRPLFFRVKRLRTRVFLASAT